MTDNENCRQTISEPDFSLDFTDLQVKGMILSQLKKEF